METETKHVAYLDGWRGLAIILVLFHHFCEFRNLGRTGVDFFFVLSGLLMSRILFVDKVPLRTFYKRRIARVFPVFYLYLLIAGIIFTTILPTFSISDVFYSAIFLHTYLPGTNIWDGSQAPIGHLWSLNVEEHCYIILSLLSIIAAKRSEACARYLTTATALSCLGFIALYKIFPPASASPIFVRTESAGFGLFASASMYLWLRHVRLTIPSWVPVASMFLGLALGISFEFGPLKFMVSPLLLALAINTIGRAPAPVLRALSNPVLVWFGVCSFSIYVCQQPFYYMTLYKQWDIPYPVAFVMAMTVATLCYYFYEKPMRRVIRNLGSR